MSDNEGLVYTGKVIAIEAIEGADFIACATVRCGPGGKWKGVVRRSEIDIAQLVTVYLPDSLIPPSEDMKFMESNNWRVRMKRFKGAPSEVVIMPLQTTNLEIGSDCTKILGVTKYHKPVPTHLQGKAKGQFPGFVPRTDEPNYQNSEGNECVCNLIGHHYYITEKCDGSSTTAFRYKGNFGVCSRNWEFERDGQNGYWKVVNKYKVEDRLPEGYAIQWETCGPKIQGNPMGLSEIDGFVFSGYKIDEQRYLDYKELLRLCTLVEMQPCLLVEVGNYFDPKNIETLGEGTYRNGKQREGVVVRSSENFGSKPLSFKVINLNYER